MVESLMKLKEILILPFGSRESASLNGMFFACIFPIRCGFPSGLSRRRGVTFILCSQADGWEKSAAGGRRREESHLCHLNEWLLRLLRRLHGIMHADFLFRSSAPLLI